MMHQEYSYCTLFDTNYLDKGIVTIDSLLRCGISGKIYILAMDEQCHRILKDYYFENSHITIIPVEEFLDQKLRKIKLERTRAEFCWTCTASLIEYILNIYSEKICTYIDADMFFYSDPAVLVDEMTEREKEIQIVEHRFRDDFYGKESVRAAGRFCVEFNTFQNTNKSREILKEWKNSTIEFCSSVSSENSMLGDQCYLTEWPLKYDCINILSNPGGGIAPWNIDRYHIVEETDGNLIVSFDGKGYYKVIFFHFHNISYLDRDTVDISVFRHHLKIDHKTVEKIYIPYLKTIDAAKSMLEQKYGVYPLLTRHPGIIETRTFKYYIGQIFSKRFIQNVLIKIHNEMTERNHKYDIYKISQLNEENMDECN